MLSEKIIDSRSCPLVHLCLRQNMLCGSRDHETFNPEPVIRLSLAISDDSNRNLTHLDLSDCDVGARSAKKLMEALKYNDSITVLDLSNCNISALGSVAVGDALPSIKNLKILHLKENCIGPVGCTVSEAFMLESHHEYSSLLQQLPTRDFSLSLHILLSPFSLCNRIFIISSVVLPSSRACSAAWHRTSL